MRKNAFAAAPLWRSVQQSLDPLAGWINGGLIN